MRKCISIGLQLFNETMNYKSEANFQIFTPDSTERFNQTINNFGEKVVDCDNSDILHFEPSL